MKRSDFLAAASSAALLGAAGSSDVTIPVELRGGRFFAIPKTLDGSVFACWLDTDGGGFIFNSAVARFHLSSRTDEARSVAQLPNFAAGAGIPPLSTRPNLDVLFDTGNDPILRGFDAQLGTTWFARRVWHIDFANGAMSMLAHPIPPAQVVVPLTFDGDAPCVPVRIGDDVAELTMTLDIAASVANRARSGRGDLVEATSFIRRDTLERWHAVHPDWSFDREVSVTPGIDRIVVPHLYIRGYPFENVAFTTRPKDDVFEGSTVAGKLGANAYARTALWIDYPNGRLRF